MSYYILPLATFIVVVILGLALFGGRPSKKNTLFYENKYDEEVTKYLNEDNRTWLERQKDYLAQSKTGITFELYVILHVASVLVVFAVAYAIFANPILPLILSPIGLIVPKRYVKARRTRLLYAFDKNLVDVLDRLVSYLRNMSIVVSFEQITGATDIHPFVRSEFLEMVVDLKANKPIEEAIKNSYKRVGSNALRLMYLQTKLDRDVGVNLSDLFISVRNQVVRKLQEEHDSRVQTSEAVAQSKGLMWISAVALVFMCAFMPAVSNFYFGSVGGRLTFTILVGIVIAGNFIINAIVKQK